MSDKPEVVRSARAQLEFQLVRVKADVYRLKKIAEDLRDDAVKEKVMVAFDKTYAALDEMQAALSWK